jgi:hypothetical protein
VVRKSAVYVTVNVLSVPGFSPGFSPGSAAHNNRPGYVLDSFGGRVYRYDGHTDARRFPAGTYIGTVQ